MKEKIESFLELLPDLTKEEVEFIVEILSWDDETKIAFRMAKKLFEETEPEEDFKETLGDYMKDPGKYLRRMEDNLYKEILIDGPTTEKKDGN